MGIVNIEIVLTGNGHSKPGIHNSHSKHRMGIVIVIVIVNTGTHRMLESSSAGAKLHYTHVCVYIYIYTYTHTYISVSFCERCDEVVDALHEDVWEGTVYTPPPPGSDFRDCDCARIETKASIHHPLWLVVVSRIGFPKCAN